MRKLILSIFLVSICAIFSQAQNNSYTCQSPPYFTKGEQLYVNSPSNQMVLAHQLIGMFRRTGYSDEDKRMTKELSDELASQQKNRIEIEYLNGVQTFVITPGIVKNDKKIVYFHGGGYTDDIILFQWNMAFDIARKSGSPVYVVKYRRVPDYIFPAPIEDGLTAYLKLLERFDASQLVFMGDSAGGGLALGLSGKLRDEELPLPSQLVLISPWLDVEGDNPDMPQYEAADLMLSVQGLQRGGVNYVGGNNLQEMDNPYASPLLLDDLNELPPSLMFIGTYEILYPDAILFKDKAEEQGMDLTTVEVEGGFHVWLGAPNWMVPESWKARKQVAYFINCGPEMERRAGGELTFEETHELTFELHVLPNPASKAFVLEIESNKEWLGALSLEVVDLEGKFIIKIT